MVEKKTELVPVSEMRAELPPILAGWHTAAVECRCEASRANGREAVMRRKSDPSSCRERLYVLVQGLSDFNPVVPMISQKGQNRQFSAVMSPEATG